MALLLILQTSEKNLMRQTKHILKNCKLELGDEMKTIPIFLNQRRRLKQEINEIKEKLFHYDFN